MVKVSVIGAGFVGSTTAFALLESGLASEIVMVDIAKAKVKAEVLDLSHGMPFVPPAGIINGEIEDCKGSDIIVFTAGVNQKPGEPRINLVGRNVGILNSMLPKFKEVCPDSLYLFVANPVDILTYAAKKVLPPDQVIGSGCVLDSARLRFSISEYYGVDVRDVNAFIAGEHGDSSLPLWSVANIAGIPLNSLKKLGDAEREQIYTDARKAAYYIIEGKVATYYGIAVCVRRIVTAILRNENSVLPISVMMEGQYGISDVCLSVPCIVNRKGLKQILEIPISESEKAALQKSADLLKGVIKEVGLA